MKTKNSLTPAERAQKCLENSNRIAKLKRQICLINADIQNSASDKKLFDALVAGKKVLQIELNYLIGGAV
jgi:hypothetical protein